MNTFALLQGPPLLAALLAVAVKPYRRFVGWANALLSLVSLGAAGALWRHILEDDVLISGPREFLRADALSTLLALCVSLVGALAAWLGPGLGGDDGYDGAQARRFRIFGNLFTFTMLFAVTSNNVGFMWIAIEATTITSAMLIPLHVTKASVEASWKYILIGSIGIALAFAGTVLGYFDFVNLAGRQDTALNWTVLMAAAPHLHPPVIQLAFVFILIGYGTKAGLAPMHTWLPDAHSEAPAPLSAMMSGVLLAVALYAVIRWEAVVNAAVGTRFTDGLFIALGVLSIVIAAFSLVVQRNYKRMLAYSSIEHTGLICVGLALGPLGTFAAMLHLLNHTLAKSMMFFLAGRVLHRYRTTEIGRVSGLLTTMPWTGGLFAAGVLAVIGLPPFGLFISEFALFRAGFAAGRPWLMGLILALLAVAFVSMIGHLNRMLYGAPAAGTAVGEGSAWPLVPLGACVAALVVLGLTLPAPLQVLLERIVEIAGR
ncbi:MAG: hydrogenase 4 subunit F [Candidatus Rokubacteria bacterium]|nr:hydrogenase 4 subunit F [Candidatus Rokubacteria bacterium]